VSWWERAACRGTGHDEWFRLYLSPVEATRLLRRCHEDCPVQEECLEHALQHPEQHGAWGGFTETELFAIRTRRYSRCRICQRRWPKARLTPTTVCRWCLIAKYKETHSDHDE
jgi:WhiB family transcriptional regulator, redox-sensing transcriptional regulator